MKFRDILSVAAVVALTAVPLASAQERDRGGDRSSSRSERSERVERWNDRGDRADRSDSQLHRDPYVGYTGRNDRWDEIRRSDRFELGADRRRENDRDVQRELIEVRDRDGEVVDRSVIIRERRSSWSDDNDRTRARVLRNPNIHGDRETIILDRRDRDHDDFLDRARHDRFDLDDRRDVDYVSKSLRHKDDDRFLHRPNRDGGTYFSLRYRDAWDDDYPYIYHNPSHYRSYRYSHGSRSHFGYTRWSRWYGYDCGPSWHSPRWRGPVIYRPYYHCPPGWSIRIDID